MALFSGDKIKAFFFNLVVVLQKQSSSRSEIVEQELALNSSPSSSGGGEESSAAVGSSESTPEDDPSRPLGELAVPAIASVLQKQSSSRSEIVEPELALNSSPSSSGGGEESSAAVGSSESTPEDDPSRPLGELAIPAIVSVAIYGSIPPAVHLEHRHAPLYEPLVAFICLAVFTSLGNIICVLLRPSARGVALLMGLSIVFSLVAFLLRILL